MLLQRSRPFFLLRHSQFRSRHRLQPIHLALDMATPPSTAIYPFQTTAFPYLFYSNPIFLAVATAPAIVMHKGISRAAGA